MAHVDYPSWQRLIRDIINAYLPDSRPSILEIGGGTGILGRLLLDNGFDYSGSDMSCSMCLEAVKKGVPFVCADGRNIPFKTGFDMVLFLYDGINYLLKPEDYTVFCIEACRCLCSGGLLLFDVTTKTNSTKYFFNLLDFDDFGDSAYVRHCHYEQFSGLQMNDFTVFCRSPHHPDQPLYEKFLEHHVQKVLPVSEIIKAIPKDLFTVTGIWDGFSFRRYSSRSERIHFLCRKN
jgi:SAM-dependent methyltransferase